MKQRFNELRQWIKQRSPRQRLYLFILGLAIIYFFCSNLLLRPLALQKKDLMDSTVALQGQKEAIEAQIDATQKVIKSPVFLQMLEEQKHLAARLAFIQKKLAGLKPTLVSLEDLPKLTKDILDQQTNNITLVSYEELPAELWPPQDNTDKNKIDLSNFVAGNMYQQAVQIEFESDYFGTINYIKSLERLPWHFYWDSMNYNVLEYPKANVVIKFHILSFQKG